MHRASLPQVLPAAALCAALIGLLSPRASAQAAEQVVDVPFPLQVQSLTESGFGGGGAVLELSAPTAGGAGGIGAGGTVLEGHPHVRFVGVPLPDGTTVNLIMNQAPTARLRFGFRIDGNPAPKLEHYMGLSVWMGKVEGFPGSSAALAFSKYGNRGWIRRGKKLFHLLARPNVGNGGWENSLSQMVEDSTLLAWGNQPHGACMVDALPVGSGPQEPWIGSGPMNGGGTLALSKELFEVPVAIETDTELFDLFGDVTAEATYVTTLLTWISYRYEEQIDAVLTYPYVQFYTQGADPWLSQETGGDSIALLYEFQAAWSFNLPTGCKLATFLSGANLGGGVAWLPGVCGQPYNFAVCGNIGGTVQFPVVQQSGNWDFIVAAHEMGHSLGTEHTHDYCPPLDECPPSAYWGLCQTQQLCSTSGTIMSYCHLCGAGIANITTYFHPQVVDRIRTYIEGAGCLPLYLRNPTIYCAAKANSQGCTPQIDAFGHATLAGLDDFHVTASNVINNQPGLLFYGTGKAALPFYGGTKCVQPPTRRTVVQDSGGTAGPDDCSGTYDAYLSHFWFNASAIAPGTILYAQYWSYDPGLKNGTGLTDAIKFEVAP